MPCTLEASLTVVRAPRQGGMQSFCVVLLWAGSHSFGMAGHRMSIECSPVMRMCAIVAAGSMAHGQFSLGQSKERHPALRVDQVPQRASPVEHRSAGMHIICQ